MKRSVNYQAKEMVGKEILIKGWMHTLRNLGKICFLIMRDRSGLIQIVIEDKEEINKIKDLQEGSILEVKGVVQESKQTELGVEVVKPRIVVLNPVTESTPIEITKEKLNAHIDTVLDLRPIALRHKKYHAIFKIQATIVKAYREILTREGFVEFFGPNIIGASSEGGTELFKVDYYGNEAMLSQSAQLYKQMMVGVYERVFALMKCFRAEKSHTRRHLAEATQFEFEMGFIDDFGDVMDMLEKVIKYIVKVVNEENKKEIDDLGIKLLEAPEDVKFPRITFKEARELVFKRTEVDERNENDLSPMAEKELCKYAKEEHGTDFIFITYYLRDKVAFYAQPNADDPEVANYFDLLGGEAEIVSGGQRIHEEKTLIESLKLKGLDPNDFTDYLSIFKYGMPAHGGFGMGMERLTMMLLRMDNIRHTTLFPSDPKRIASVKISSKVYFGDDIGAEIINRLQNGNYQFEQMRHEPTKTSEISAKIRGTKMSEGIKAIILKGKKTGKNVMVCVPSDQKIDLTKISELEGEKFEFEKPEVLMKKFGLEPGSVPPFGNLLGIETYYSKKIKSASKAAFNRGSINDSIIMNSADLIDLVDPKMY